MHGSLAYCTDILVVNIADGQVKISVQEVCKTDYSKSNNKSVNQCLLKY